MIKLGLSLVFLAWCKFFILTLFKILFDSYKKLATEKREPFDGRKEKEKTRRKDQDGHCSEKGESTAHMPEN